MDVVLRDEDRVEKRLRSKSAFSPIPKKRSCSEDVLKLRECSDEDEICFQGFYSNESVDQVDEHADEPLAHPRQEDRLPPCR